MARVAVPLVGNGLSAPLAVIALVSHYLANKLIARRPIIERIASLLRRSCEVGDYRELVRLSADYTRLDGMFLRITTPFAATKHIKILCARPRDLHALSTPPAFVLS